MHKDGQQTLKWLPLDIVWFLAYFSFWQQSYKLLANSLIYDIAINIYLSLLLKVNRSKEDFIQDFFDRYDTSILPPVWKTLEVASFGVLSNLLNFPDKCLRENSDVLSKTKLAAKYAKYERVIKCL